MRLRSLCIVRRAIEIADGDDENYREVNSTKYLQKHRPTDGPIHTHTKRSYTKAPTKCGKCDTE